VSFVSMYSKTDAIVDWQACLDPHARNVEVDGSHCGMGVAEPVYRALAVELERIVGAQRAARGEQALAA
jgi:hypothetical protein